MRRASFPRWQKRSARAFLKLALVACAWGVLGAACSGTRAAPPRLDGVARQLRPPPGLALVYVIRPEFMGQTVRFDVKVNGVWIGSTGGFRYIVTYLRPGQYLFQSRAENLASLRINVQAGRTYFIEQRPVMGLLMPGNELVLLPEEEGRRRLRHCALSMAMPGEVLAFMEAGGQGRAAAPAGAPGKGRQVNREDAGVEGPEGSGPQAPPDDGGGRSPPPAASEERPPSESREPPPEGESF